MNDLEDIELEDIEREGNYRYNKKRINQQFYIDRDGYILKYKGDMYERIVSMHHSIAEEHFPKADYPKDQALKVGWVSVGGIGIYNPIITREPSQAQINTLYDLHLFDRLEIQP